MVRREKAIFHTMNKLSLDVTSKVGISVLMSYITVVVEHWHHGTLGTAYFSITSLMFPFLLPFVSNVHPLFPQVLIAEVWLPNTCLDRIQAVLNKAAEGSNTQLRSVVQAVTTDEEPPTHFETNKFTACFQTIVEAYGVARYREVRDELERFLLVR